ncbi:cobaltochelatase CobT-related protein [Hominifimenecus sp. rT4P-3]|uniref:cobaltochelatase CobT-related protein n=1 Tax=Hominifimenecus sp. rT4P-3 TaxID=3242979 RepID=UPI003DA1DA0C
MSFQWENRLKNMMWTVSGDYSERSGTEAEEEETDPGSVDIALYDAVKQGALSRYFDREELSLYLLKKIYLGAEEKKLLRLARLAADSAVLKRLTEERAGIPGIRRAAFLEALEEQFEDFVKDEIGRLTIQWMKQEIYGSSSVTKREEQALSWLDDLKKESSTRSLMETIDRLYNLLGDPRFEQRHGGLEQVLSVTLEDLKEMDWRAFLEEEALEETLEEYQKRLDVQAGETPGSSQGENPHPGGKTAVIQVDEETLRKRQTYVELNFGPSVLPEAETVRLNRLLCRDAHENCRIHFTEGILKNPRKINYQYQYARKQKEQNEIYYRRHASLARKSVAVLTALLRKSLVRRKESEFVISESGNLIPSRLWVVGRTEPRRLFRKEEKKNQEDFVVDMLIDASGSQRKRQSQVAVQGYIISEALSALKIPHRILSFCSFWDTTVLHRFRDYEDGPEANTRIFDLFTSSNNRDGLAIRAAAEGLFRRPEDGKVLIVLSDGRPNDRVVSRGGGKAPRMYADAYAVQDTAYEVRKIRAKGVAVLGVFAGEEKDLPAERKIFGKDFAYIRDISGFSHTVGRYLRRLIEEAE